MAKPVRSGLGRGLSSLMGGPVEQPQERTTKRDQVEYEEDFDYANVSRETSTGTSMQNSQVEIIKESVREDKVEPNSYLNKSSEILSEKELLAAVKKRMDEIPVSDISPNPDQPRTNFKQDELEELAKSIKQDGLLQPILVRPIGNNKYQIIAGERRWQACKLAGIDKVPVRIKEVDDDRALELALVENVQRSDLNPIEEAYGYKRLMDRKKMTQADIAQSMSKGRSTVANALRLLELPEDAQQLLFEDKITAGHARAILSIQSKEGREKLTEKLKEKKLTVRETESLARLMSLKPGERAREKDVLPQTFKTVAKALKDVLKTPVKVKSSNGKNKIEIEFKDETDLKRLFEELIATVS
ncbi:ParB/RepB/Spo0J family partition protein [Adlercreutzia sp. ZJ304]|uniref:ParB/RepB/Spo0J family partition protein n=1 Tax=Adlercreutzia sp. ZJ304 TaxID=2709791 RepID=UPI001F153300|nr:ParB/RepB/Spo0J family partition protein [Adlercreutzia sp. ZJ304]